MPTPVSAATPYCSGTQFLVWYDVRTVAQTLADQNAALDPASVATNGNLLAILSQASGKVEAATLLGGKYTVADLQALTGNMALFLAGLVADLAAPKVLGRRFVEFPDYADRLKEAEGVLAALAKGEIVFGLQAQIDAGVMETQTETTQDVDNRQLSTFTARRYFGRRNNRIGRDGSDGVGGCYR